MDTTLLELLCCYGHALELSSTVYFYPTALHEALRGLWRSQLLRSAQIPGHAGPQACQNPPDTAGADGNPLRTVQ